MELELELELEDEEVLELELERELEEKELPDVDLVGGFEGEELFERELELELAGVAVAPLPPPRSAFFCLLVAREAAEAFTIFPLTLTLIPPPAIISLPRPTPPLFFPSQSPLPRFTFRASRLATLPFLVSLPLPLLLRCLSRSWRPAPSLHLLSAAPFCRVIRPLPPDSPFLPATLAATASPSAPPPGLFCRGAEEAAAAAAGAAAFFCFGGGTPTRLLRLTAVALVCETAWTFAEGDEDVLFSLVPLLLLFMVVVALRLSVAAGAGAGAFFLFFSCGVDVLEALVSGT